MLIPRNNRVGINVHRCCNKLCTQIPGNYSLTPIASVPIVNDRFAPRHHACLFKKSPADRCVANYNGDGKIFESDRGHASFETGHVCGYFISSRGDLSRARRFFIGRMYGMKWLIALAKEAPRRRKERGRIFIYYECHPRGWKTAVANWVTTLYINLICSISCTSRSDAPVLRFCLCMNLNERGYVRAVRARDATGINAKRNLW